MRSMMDKDFNENVERRHFYRIDNEVGFHFEILGDDSILPTYEQFLNETPVNARIFSELEKIELETLSALRNIQSSHKDLFLYLKGINRKINILAANISALSSENEFQIENITLSAGGISFYHHEPIKRDEYLRLSLMLYPSCHEILCYARVMSIASEGNKNQVPNPYCISVEYVLIREADRDALVKHVLAIQSDFLRAKKDKELLIQE